MKDGVSSRDYVDLELLNQQLQELEQSLQMADQELEYASVAISMISELKTLDKNQEILIPIGNGVFFTVHAGDVKQVKVAVGSGVVVDKTPEEASKFVNEQVNELEDYREKSIQLYQQVAEKALLLQKKMESELRKG